MRFFVHCVLLQQATIIGLKSIYGVGMKVIGIDGSIGEGGGQILRSALCLSLLTGQTFVLENIRAARTKPGLRPQHLAAVKAAARISQAVVSGDRIGSTKLCFEPGVIQPGEYHFSIGTAGATSLVLQTVLLPLAMADGGSRITISGGTHVPWSTCYHYLDWNWRPVLAQMGIRFDLRLTRAGFYPMGGGEISAVIAGCSVPASISLQQRGELRRIRGISGIANLPMHIAERQRSQAMRRLKRIAPGAEVEVRIEPLTAFSPGTTLLLQAEFQYSRACFFALGAKGKPAERVADEAVEALEKFMLSSGTVDPWLADQLLLPLALARTPSQLNTSEVTQHLLTNAGVIRRFIPVDIQVDGGLGEAARVEVRPGL